MNNNDMYDNTETNLKENLLHTFSDEYDVIPLSAGDLLNLKNILVQCYKERSPIFNDALGANKGIDLEDPLRAIIKYLA